MGELSIGMLCIGIIGELCIGSTGELCTGRVQHWDALHWEHWGDLHWKHWGALHWDALHWGALGELCIGSIGGALHWGALRWEHWEPCIGSTGRALHWGSPALGCSALGALGSLHWGSPALGELCIATLCFCMLITLHPGGAALPLQTLLGAPISSLPRALFLTALRSLARVTVSLGLPQTRPCPICLCLSV